MASGQWPAVLGQVHRLFQGGAVSGLTEGQLLDRFVADRDEVAFGAIVARHGSMVLGVCRGVLVDPDDVEDAFQATFLILVRKARGLRDRDRLAPWLYGVARKVALRARADASRRRARERSVAGPDPGAAATSDSDLRELQAMVREEVDRLPGNDRMAVVLCYLDGLTHQEAADRLGWPVGTVKGRLARARDRLRARLTRRGVALPVGALASALAREAPAADLMAATVGATARLAGGGSLTAGIVSAHALILTEGVIRTMFTAHLKTGALALAATCALGVPGVLAWQGGEGSGEKPAPKVGKSPGGAGPEAASGKIAIPAGATPGRADLAQDASRALQVLDQLRARGEVVSPQSYDTWSRRLLDAQLGNASREEKIAVLKAYVARRAKLKEEVVNLQAAGDGNPFDRLDAEYRHHEALIWLAEAEAARPTPEKPIAPGSAGGMGMGVGMMGMGTPPEKPAPTPAEEKRNRAILAKLEEPISMNFPNETPIEDIKKYIEQATQDEPAGFPTGLPIYVDPKGLTLVGETMTSTVTINLEGIPLRTTLRLILSQIDLRYTVEDGLLIITNDPRAPRNTKKGSRLNQGGFQ